MKYLLLIPLFFACNHYKAHHKKTLELLNQKGPIFSNVDLLARDDLYDAQDSIGKYGSLSLNCADPDSLAFYRRKIDVYGGVETEAAKIVNHVND